MPPDKSTRKSATKISIYMNSELKSETCHLFIENAQTSGMNKNNVLTVIGSFYCLISHDLPNLINSTPWRCWRCNCCWKWCFLHGATSRPWALEVGVFYFFWAQKMLFRCETSLVWMIYGFWSERWFLPPKMVGKISPLNPWNPKTHRKPRYLSARLRTGQSGEIPEGIFQSGGWHQAMSTGWLSSWKALSQWTPSSHGFFSFILAVAVIFLVLIFKKKSCLASHLAL